MRLGVFGGEFDPPHAGHLAVARAVRDQLRLDGLLIVPAGTPPHRAASSTPADQRLRMAELAFAGEPGVEVSRIEIDREGPSYTVDTLRALAPGNELVLVVGADQDVDTWHLADEVRRLAQVVVAPRAGGAAALHHPGVIELDMAPVDVSSTEVREALARGGGDGDVAPAVLELIRREGLYAEAPC